MVGRYQLHQRGKCMGRGERKPDVLLMQRAAEADLPEIIKDDVLAFRVAVAQRIFGKLRRFAHLPDHLPCGRIHRAVKRIARRKGIFGFCQIDVMRRTDPELKEIIALLDAKKLRTELASVRSCAAVRERHGIDCQLPVEPADPLRCSRKAISAVHLHFPFMFRFFHK